MTKTKPWNIKEGVYLVEIHASKTRTLKEMREEGLETPSTQDE